MIFVAKMEGGSKIEGYEFLTSQNFHGLFLIIFPPNTTNANPEILQAI